MALRIGSSDNDSLSGTFGADQIFGLGGDDRLEGRRGSDEMDGGAGNDVLFGGIGRDVFHASLGNDSYFGGAGVDVVTFENADRFVTVNIVTDNSAFASLTDGKNYNSIEAVRGTVFDDVLTSYGEVRKVCGGQGNDRIDAWVNGLDANDKFFGGAQDDILIGRGGDDKLFGGRHDDDVFGGAGNDRLAGGRGADQLFAGGGDDLVKGRSGHDTMDGGTGEDILRGGAGRDTLNGGFGDDILKGGNKADRFVFQPGGGTDTVVDFSPGAKAGRKNFGDTIYIADFDFPGTSEEIFDLLRPDMKNTEAGLLIDYGDGTILLEGLRMGQVEAGWFDVI